MIIMEVKEFMNLGYNTLKEIKGSMPLTMHGEFYNATSQLPKGSNELHFEIGSHAHDISWGAKKTFKIPKISDETFQNRETMDNVHPEERMFYYIKKNPTSKPHISIESNDFETVTVQENMPDDLDLIGKPLKDVFEVLLNYD